MVTSKIEPCIICGSCCKKTPLSLTTLSLSGHPYATPKVTKYQRCNFIIQIHQFTIKIDKIYINLLYECVKIVEFNFNSYVFHVMYQETRFLNQDACFFKWRRETIIYDQFCFREGLKPSTWVGIQGLQVLMGLHDSCSSQIDWS